MAEKAQKKRKMCDGCLYILLSLYTTSPNFEFVFCSMLRLDIILPNEVHQQLEIYVNPIFLELKLFCVSHFSPYIPLYTLIKPKLFNIHTPTFDRLWKNTSYVA